MILVEDLSQILALLKASKNGDKNEFLVLFPSTGMNFVFLTSLGAKFDFLKAFIRLDYGSELTHGNISGWSCFFKHFPFVSFPELRPMIIPHLTDGVTFRDDYEKPVKLKVSSYIWCLESDGRNSRIYKK